MKSKANSDPAQRPSRTKRLGILGVMALALSSCTDKGQSPLPDTGQQKVEIFNRIARQAATIANCALANSKTGTFTFEEAVRGEGLRTAEANRINGQPPWQVARSSDGVGQWAGDWPRRGLPPIESHVGITVEGDVPTKSIFWAGAISVKGAEAAVTDMTPYFVALYDHPNVMFVYNTDDPEKRANYQAREPKEYVALETLAVGEVTEFGQDMNVALTFLLEKAGLQQQCGDAIF